VQIMDSSLSSRDDGEPVDQRLVSLAKRIEARMATNDYNLNKLAKVNEVDVININDLANALKPVFMPGENTTVRIIKPGEEPGQGVGYLEDGTMVVAEGGRNHIGDTVSISVTSVLQTSAGRMVFGRIEDGPQHDPERRRARSRSATRPS